MNELKARIQDDMKNAMKQRDTFALSTLRLLVSDIQTAEKSGKTPKEFSVAEVEAFISKAVKTRRGSAEIYANAEAHERAAKENAEADLLAAYLPQQMTENEVVEMVRSAVDALDDPNMGLVMKSVKPQIGNSFDGRRLSEIVKAELNA